MIEENIFGEEPIELVISYAPFTVKKFDKKKYSLPFAQLESLLSRGTHHCYFQNSETDHHKITIPLQDYGQIVFFCTWTEQALRYSASRKQAYQPTLKAIVDLPQDAFILEKCTIKLADKDSRQKGDYALEQLFEEVEELETTSAINIDKENEIWFKYIDASQKIIKKRQKPFAVKRYSSLQPVHRKADKATKFSFKVDLKIEKREEHKTIEERLRKLQVSTHNARFNEGGTIELTLLEIFDALDPILRKEFKKGAVVRNQTLTCVLPITPVPTYKQLQQELKELNYKVTVSNYAQKKQLVLASTTNDKEVIALPKTIIDQYQLVRAGFYTKIHSKKKNKTTHKVIETTITPTLKGSKLMRAKKQFINKVAQEERFFIAQGGIVKQISICETYTYDKYTTSDFTKDFWTNVKRDLYPLSFEVQTNPRANNISFTFQTKEELLERIEQIQASKLFTTDHKIEQHKYKVNTTILAQEIELAQLKDKIDQLRGAEFEIVTPILDKKTKSWSIPEGTYTDKLFIGHLNNKLSTISCLHFIINLETCTSQQKKAFKKLKQLIEEKAPINSVIPNLIGEAKKISWLKEAVEKLTNPTHEANGKPINTRLKDFIFDSSKATPIYEEQKINEGSIFWEEVKQSQLSKNLNPSQIRAILAALHTTDLCLLQGPPGTGKTTVISEIVWQQIRQEANNPNRFRILLTSETNLAVDNALEKLIGTHTTIVKPLRFGRSEKFEEEGKRYALDRINKWAEGATPSNNSQQPVLLNLEEEVENLVAEDTSNNAVQRWMLSIGERAQQRAEPKYAAILKNWQLDLAQPSTDIRLLFKEKYFRYANVIGSTCSSCGSHNFKKTYHEIFNPITGEKADDVLKLIGKSSDDVNRIWKILRDDLDMDVSNLSKQDFPRIQKKLGEQFSISFDAVIMDEASKATPPEMVLPLCFGKKSIIIGDHKQLPPMINDREFRDVLIEEAEEEQLAQEIGEQYLKESQFKRLIVNPKSSPTIQATFDMQYRMHSQIGNLIQQFYPELENGLICGIKAKEDVQDLKEKASRHHGFYHDHFITPNTHVIWVDVPAPEQKDGTSRINVTEVETVKKVLQYLKHSEGYEEFQKHWAQEPDKDKRLQEQEIGIISFYGKQVKELMEVKKYAQKELDMQIRLKTVDKFQGMERNIIIVSTVRSNTLKDTTTGKVTPNKKRGRYSPWGFADSPERLNVALSRAKRLLIVVGNREHFADFENEEGEAIYKNVIAQIPHKNILNYNTLDKYEV